MRRLDFKNMADKMAYMEEKYAEVILVTCRNMDDMEDKASDMAR